MKKNAKISFLLFFFFVALENMAANFAHPITPTLIQELQLPDYSFGVLYAGMAFTNFLFSPMWAKQVKRLGSRMVLCVCCIGYGIGQLCFAFFTSLSTILFARMLSGFFVGGIMVSFLTYIIHVCEIENRGKYLALSATFASVFGAFGYVVGGFAGVFSIFNTFLLQSITLMVCGIGFYFVMQEDKSMVKTSFHLWKDANPFQAFIDSKAFINVLFVFLFVAVFLGSTASTAYDQCFNYYIKDQFLLDSSYNGMIKAIVGIISLFANTTVCVWLMKHTNVAKSSIYVMGIGGMLLMGITCFDAIYIFALMNVLFYGINAMYIPLLQDLCAKQSYEKNKEMVMGLYNAMKSLGMIAGALCAGFLYEVHVKLSFLFAAILFLVCAIILYFYYHKNKAVQ